MQIFEMNLWKIWNQCFYMSENCKNHYWNPFALKLQSRLLELKKIKMNVEFASIARNRSLLFLAATNIATLARNKSQFVQSVGKSRPARWSSTKRNPNKDLCSHVFLIVYISKLLSSYSKRIVFVWMKCKWKIRSLEIKSRPIGSISSGYSISFSLRRIWLNKVSGLKIKNSDLGFCRNFLSFINRRMVLLASLRKMIL